MASLRSVFESHEVAYPEWIDERFDPDRLAAYFEFLVEKNDDGGFFSKGDSDQIFIRHFYESLLFAYYVSSAAGVSRETKLADAGSGPGLPGYLFSCLKEGPAVTLIDSSRRRLQFVEQFEQEHYVSSTLRFRYGRIEEMSGSFDLIVCRAFIPFPHLLELFCKLQKESGWVALATTRERIGDERSVAFHETLGYVSRETLTPEEFGMDSSRCILMLQKMKRCPSGYPRKWGKIKEEIESWRT